MKHDRRPGPTWNRPFDNYPGTYWYAQDYIERDDGSGGTLSMGSGSDTHLKAVYGENIIGIT